MSLGPYLVGDEVIYDGPLANLKGLRGRVEKVSATGKVAVMFKGQGSVSFVPFNELKPFKIRQLGLGHHKGTLMQRFFYRLGFNSELHRQVYHGVREFPHAFIHTNIFSFSLGMSVMALIHFIVS
jgi:hypothetical protein